MSEPNRSFASALASNLADLGVEHVCISPGSRNTPLIAGFAAEPRIRKWPLLDERSAGFFAIGLARSTGKPVALACTSGTAAAEYHPAVVEASQSEVPLLVMTADRPEELRNVGAPQTIDQLSLYGSSPRLFIDAPTPDAATTAQSAADLASKAWTAATSGTPGPVHLNLPFREPLLTAGNIQQSGHLQPIFAQNSEPLQLTTIAKQLNGRRGIIVAGRTNDRDFAQACSELAAALMWPIFADPLSGLRHGDHHLDRVLAYGDSLAAAGALDRLQPEIALRFGPVPTSKPTWKWLEDHAEIDQILVDLETRDATHSATTTLALPPTAAAVALTDGVSEPAPLDWAKEWAALDDLAGQTIVAALQPAPFPNEPSIAQTVLASAPPGAIVTVGSSMPIRDVDAFGGKSPSQIRILGNRGSNGIDGIVSAAIGAAASGAPSIAIIGDVSLFHDINSLGTAAQLDLPVTIVVVNNDGGGIFHFLPQHDPSVLPTAAFESFLATPHGTDFVPIATAFGLDTHNINDQAELAQLLATPGDKARLIQLRTDRDQNLELHRTVSAAVKRAIVG